MDYNTAEISACTSGYSDYVFKKYIEIKLADNLMNRNEGIFLNSACNPDLSCQKQRDKNNATLSVVNWCLLSIFPTVFSFGRLLALFACLLGVCCLYCCHWKPRFYPPLYIPSSLSANVDFVTWLHTRKLFEQIHVIQITLFKTWVHAWCVWIVVQ